MIDSSMQILLGIVFGALVSGTVTGQLLKRRAHSEAMSRLALNLNDRMRAWWIMVAVFVVSILVGGIATIVLFGVSSFLAFREFITLTPTRRGDHRALFRRFSLSFRFNSRWSPSNGTACSQCSSRSMHLCSYPHASPLPVMLQITSNEPVRFNGA